MINRQSFSYHIILCYKDDIDLWYLFPFCPFLCYIRFQCTCIISCSFPYGLAILSLYLYIYISSFIICYIHIYDSCSSFDIIQSMLNILIDDSYIMIKDNIQEKLNTLVILKDDIHKIIIKERQL